MMVLMKLCLARGAHSAGSNRWAPSRGFSLCAGSGVSSLVALAVLALGATWGAPAHANETPPAAASSPAAKSSAPSAATSSPANASDPEQADRMEKRKERLTQGAQRLRERAAELRKRIANGETVAEQAPNSKRPPRPLEEQAARFEEQANRMEERAKNLDSESAPGGERSPEFARQRRHQLRRSHLNRRWGGATLRDPEAVAELKVHAERVAKLKRIRTLAMDKSKDDPMAKRAKDLLSKEEDRHELHMKAIQARVAPAAAAAAAAADAPAGGTIPVAAPGTPAPAQPASPPAPAEEQK